MGMQGCARNTFTQRRRFTIQSKLPVATRKRQGSFAAPHSAAVKTAQSVTSRAFTLLPLTRPLLSRATACVPIARSTAT